MNPVKIELSNFSNLWRNLVNEICPITRQDYQKLTAHEKLKHCDEIHTALKQRYGFKIIYAGGDIPSRMYADFLVFSDEENIEYFINKIIPKFASKS